MSGDNDNEIARQSIANPYLKKPPASENCVIKDTSDGTTSSNASLTSIPQNAQQQEQNLKKPAPQPQAVNEKQTFGEKDPAVERLPSRNVSFGAAEILTVSELHKHAASFVDRSVRITGAVLLRHVASDGNVCFVLKDPCIKQTLKAAPSSILKTPGIKRRSLGGGGGSSVRLVTRKRPLSSLKKTLVPIDPVENIVSSLVNQQTVLVYAVSKQMPVDTATVGDLVMFIGQGKQQATTEPAVETILEKWNEKSPTTSNTFVHARLMRNVNGTDMRVHDEALKMRRMYLQETFAGEHNEISPSVGLGPILSSNKEKTGNISSNNNKTDNDVEMSV